MAGKANGHQRGGQPTGGQEQHEQTAGQHQHPQYTLGGYSGQEARQNIPAELCHLAHWGTFRLAWNAETAHLDKTPVAGFSSTDPATHQTFSQACAALERKRGAAYVLGFALPADRSITGLDFDRCFDAETGALLPWAAALLAPFLGKTYIERTPSGRGLRAYVRGQKPGNRCKATFSDDGELEIYDNARLFTMTGRPYADAPATIAPMQDELDALYAGLFPAKPEPPDRAAPRGQGQVPALPLALDDQALLAKARNPRSERGHEFAALWAGDWAGRWKTASHADFALAKQLAWWTDSDRGRIERLMRASGLVRDKWDKRDGRYGTHLQRTIENAILANGGRYYSGATATFGGCQDDTCENEPPAQETSTVSSPNSAYDDCADKDKLIAQLRRENEQLLHELKKERERVKQLAGELAWERKLRANKQLSPAQRIVGSALREQWKKAQAKGAQEEMPVHLPTLAKQTGMSERTVSTTIQQFHSMGAAKRDARPVIAQSGPNKGKRVTHLFVDPRPLIEQPEVMKPEKPRNHGGKRVCPECGSKHLRVKIKAQITCMECGNKWETESAERILRGDEEEMAARSDTLLAESSFGTRQLDTSEIVDATAENCGLDSVQIRGGKNLQEAPDQNHRVEREQILALVEELGYQTRIPVGLNLNEGGTLVRWQTFAAQADNRLIDEALRQLRIRAEAYREQKAVS